LSKIISNAKAATYKVTALTALGMLCRRGFQFETERGFRPPRTPSILHPKFASSQYGTVDFIHPSSTVWITTCYICGMVDDPLGLAGRTFTFQENGPATVSKAAAPHEDLFDRIFGATNESELENFDPLF
jgi:hypothetical protein